SSSSAELAGRGQKEGRVDREAARRVTVGVIHELDSLVIEDIGADLRPLPTSTASAVESRILHGASGGTIDRCCRGGVEGSIPAERVDDGSRYGAGSADRARPRPVRSDAR